MYNYRKPKSNYKKIDPEVKRKYNEKYYSTHKEQIIQSCNNYMRNERAKEHSPIIEKQREHLRKYYHEVVKNHLNKWSYREPAQRPIIKGKKKSEHWQKHRTSLVIQVPKHRPLRVSQIYNMMCLIKSYYKCFN